MGAHHAANTIGFQMAAASLGGTLLPAFGGYMAQRISLETIPAMLVFTILAMLLLYLFSTHFKSVAETL